MVLPRVTIEARTAADPELRFSPTGMAISRLRLVASSRKKNDATGEWEDDKVLWIDATAFNKLAENIAESVGKGDLVVVTGRLQTDEWTTPEGEKRSKIALVVDTLGVDLKFRTVKHGEGRVERSSGGGAPAGDPWASAAPAAQQDEPPF